MIDVHSHVLPGVDDGAEDLIDSVEIIRGLASQGVTDLIITPHYISVTRQANPRSDNLVILNQLRDELHRQGIAINTYLGNEIYIDFKIANLLSRGRISPLADSNFLLIELPMSGDFEGFEDIFLRLQRDGWQVVLAHPERYHSTQREYQILEDLYQQGVLFQCNLGSLIGQYGRSAQKLAKRLLKDDYVFCLGTDIHHQRDYREINKAQKKLRHLVGKERSLDLLETNPKQIIG